KIRVREAREESSESGEMGEVSASKVVEHAIEKLREQEEREGEISCKVEDALESLDENEINNIDEPGENQKPRYGEFQSKEEFDRALQDYPESELRKDFEERYQDSEAYFEELERGEKPLKPELVEEIECKELRRKYEEENGGHPEVRIESMEDVDRLMEEHSDDAPKSDQSYQKAEMYFEIRNESEKSQHQLAEEYGVSQSKISNCQRGVETGLVKRLRECEENRIIREWAESRLALEDVEERLPITRESIRANEDLDVQRIRPEIVKECMNQIRESNNLGPKEVSDAISQMMRDSFYSESRVRLADLSQSEIENKMISEFERALRDHRREIQENLKECLESEDARVGMVKGKLYVWTPDRTRNDLVNAWHDQYFYMNKREAAKLAKASASRLDLGNSLRERLQNLNDLMHQMIGDGPSSDTIKIDRNYSRMIGEAVHIQRDVLGIKNQDFEERIIKVTGINGHGGISNPKFLEGAKLETWRAGLIGAALSDCHIRTDDSVVEYYEENLDRLNRFRESLKEIGDFTNEPTFQAQSNLFRLKLPSPYGKALNYWGVPSGDKAIKNPELPSDFRNWSTESKCKYGSEMTSEESNISSGRCSWPRSNVVRTGEKKIGTYEFKSGITEKEVDLIKEKGKTRSGEFEGDKTIPYGLIDDLKNDANSDVAKTAHQLEETIHKNRNKLIESERDLYSDLGIEITISPKEIRYYGRTGRVSVKWEAKTSSSEATIRLGIMCPPNHPTKEVALKKWIDTRKPEEIQSVLEEIENDKFVIPEEWRNSRNGEIGGRKNE
ncbi:MAG: hypothetical protein ACFFCX_00005, partial [Candidatus Sifarchaeia archaeon]